MTSWEMQRQDPLIRPILDALAAARERIANEEIAKAQKAFEERLREEVMRVVFQISQQIEIRRHEQQVVITVKFDGELR